jgi:hypothetical protein
LTLAQNIENKKAEPKLRQSFSGWLLRSRVWTSDIDA